MTKQTLFVFVTIAAAASRISAVLPEHPSGPLRLIKNQGIIAPPPASPGYPNSTSGLPDENSRRLSTAAQAGSLLEEFTTRAGQGWLVQWNPLTGTPQVIAGRALALPGAKRLTKENIERACLDFVAANASLLKVQPGQLRLADKVKAGGRWYVSFQQVQEGVPVLGGQLRTCFTRDDRLNMVILDIYPDIAVETKPKVQRREAVRIALADCGGAAENCRISGVQLCIMPIRQAEGFTYTLCWKLYIQQSAINRKWQYLINAAGGGIVGKTDALVYENVTGTIRGEYKPEFGSDSNQVTTFPHEDVSARGPELVIKSWNFDSDPCWAAGGRWMFGPPAAGGGFCGDPGSAYSGTNIYGYNLGGNYRDDMTEYYLVTPAIDCSGYESVHLKFMRWLGVESSYFDNASIEVSNDGAEWTTVWNNPVDAICDGEWVSVIYDISAAADLQRTVYIRWVMGPTDYSVVYPGWNIDDVEIVSILGGTNIVQTQGDGSYSVAPPWDVCTIISELKGPYCDINYGCGQDAQFTQTQVHPSDVADFTWNSSLYKDITESSVYRHVNYVHDYFTAMDSGLSESSPYFPSGLDYPMPVRVQVDCTDGYCNAYWDGDGLAFGAGDGQFCDDFGLYSEIIYHEYTHAVTSKIYDGVYFPYALEPGALGEAWSDYFGCILSPSRSPLMGDGGALLEEPNGFRTLENTYRRETDWVSEVHADSQMLSGSIWDARQAITEEIDAQEWDEMVHFACYAHPQTFEDYLLAILAEDDTRYGDNNISNGTPHSRTIYTAFGSHGIGGLQYLAPSLVIDDSRANANGGLEPGEMVNLSLTLTNGWVNATGVSAGISTTDPFVTIIKGTADFPSVNHGGQVNNASDPFIILLKPDCPETHTINFRLDVAAGFVLRPPDGWRTTEKGGPYDYSRMCLLTYAVAVNQLAYDDGQVDEHIGHGDKGGAVAVRVTPQSYPCYPTHIRFVPYEDSGITVKVWDNDGPRGSPGTVLGSIKANVKGAGGWFDVDISSLALKIDSGSFYIGWVEGGTTYYNGLDMDPPYQQRSWAYFPSFDVWLPFEQVGLLGNLMVRVRECPIAAAPVVNITTGKKYCGIQAAINTARIGDQIVVGKGTYYENINFKGKDLVLRSTDPNDWAVVAATIIKGVSYSGGEDVNCVLTGFTITSDSRGIAVTEAFPTIANCIVEKNAGEGVYISYAGPVLSNCIISGNGAGGIVVSERSEPVIRNCTIAGNRGSGVTVNMSSPTITNSILWDNQPEQITGTRGYASISYSDVQGGWSGAGNIDADPCFVSTGYWTDANDQNIPAGPNDANAIWVRGDYHLKSQGWRWDSELRKWDFDRVTSRAIDAGNPGSALGREPTSVPDDPDNRWGRNLRMDMGAFGGTAEASMPPYGWAVLGDLTNDGTVDLADLAQWAEEWLKTGDDQSADLSRDRTVDLIDFAQLAEDWGTETSWHD